METTSLTDADWEILLPGKPWQIGTKTIDLKPLGVADFAVLLRNLKSVIGKIAEAGITIDNYKSKLPELAGVILVNAPGIISTLSGLNAENARRLPVAKAVELLALCFEVNIDSQDELVKNLMTLTEQVTQLTGGLQGTVEEINPGDSLG